MPGSHAQGNVDHRLNEIIRILLARFANDKYFCALRSRKAQDMGLTEARIDAGSRTMRVMDATKIDAAFYNELKKHYSEPQIMDLGAFIAFHYGMQMFMRSVGAAAPKNPQ